MKYSILVKFTAFSQLHFGPFVAITTVTYYCWTYCTCISLFHPPISSCMVFMFNVTNDDSIFWIVTTGSKFQPGLICVCQMDGCIWIMSRSLIIRPCPFSSLYRHSNNKRTLLICIFFLEPAFWAVLYKFWLTQAMTKFVLKIIFLC